MFSKIRDRLLSTEMSREVMAAILAHRAVAPLLSDDHFPVDGTLVKGEPPRAPPVRARWRTASMKSFRPKTGDGPAEEDPGGPSGPKSLPETAQMTGQNRNAEVNFRSRKRSSATHVSTTGPEARLYKKSQGTGATLCFIGHALMENRSGLVGQSDLTRADGHAERRAALDMIHRHSPGSTRRLTPGADKAFDTADFVADLRTACVTPHVAQKSGYVAIDGRTTRHKGYALSIRRRKRSEQTFGWAKTVGGMPQTLYRGVERVRARFILTMVANTLARLPKLLAA